MLHKEIRWVGLDLSTTGLAGVGRTVGGEEVFSSTPMLGKKTYHGQPAYDLKFVPAMLHTVFQGMEAKGFRFAKKGGLCLSVRQHDPALLDENYDLVAPALSWEFGRRPDDPSGDSEVLQLQGQGFEDQVGTIEKRFIVPKMMWLFTREPNLKDVIHLMMTTGDWISLMLTGVARLSTSDGLSNALLMQATKELASEALEFAGFELSWFPEPILSGRYVGTVLDPPGAIGLWGVVRDWLAGWDVFAGLGDNDAGARGSGLADFISLIMSLGSSGTVTRIAEATATLASDLNILTFEYFRHRLLLLMLGRCASWYNDYKEAHSEARNTEHALLDARALEIGLDKALLIKPDQYPNNFDQLTLGAQVASIQKSIAFEMVERFADMIQSVKDPDASPIKRILITGGMKRSRFLLQAIEHYLMLLCPRIEILVSALEEPFADQGAARGAMMTAMLGTGEFEDYQKLVTKLCPTKPLREELTR